jgi:DNA-binding MarR family transcriptional regulator
MSTNLEALGRAVKQAQHRQHRLLEAALAPLDTTVVQWDAMRAIGRAPGASAHDLAVATFQSDQAFGTLANRLEALGMITRRPGGGRRIEHHLTAAGEAKLLAASAVAERVRGEVFAGLGEADRAALQRILAALLRDEPDPISLA